MGVDFRLLVISDRLACAPTPLPEFVGFLATHGCRAFLLREKNLNHVAYAHLGDDVLAAVRNVDGSTLRMIVHSDEQFAAARSLDIHVSESDIASIARIRRLRGEAVLIGASTHSLDTARLAEDEGASYILFGPVFDTPSKRPYGLPQGLEKLREVCGAVSIPVFAVGGIVPENSGLCVASGAFGVACIGAVLPAGNAANALEGMKIEIGKL